MNDGEALVKDYLEIRRMREKIKAEYESDRKSTRLNSSH